MSARTSFVALLLLAACGNPGPSPETPTSAAALATPAPAAAAPQTPRPGKSDAEKTVADVAVGSPDHTTLVAALQAAGLVTALDSPGGIYTVFAPTNEAFDALPAGTVDGLLKPEKKEDLTKILKHHATVPIINPTDMKDGEQVSMSDGTKVTLHVQGDQIMVDDAHVVATVHAMNGVVYVVDKVLLPPS